MRRYGTKIVLWATVVLCLWFTRGLGAQSDRAVATPPASGARNTRIPYLFPYTQAFRYPRLPDQFYVFKGDRKPKRPMFTAKTRSEVVSWADRNRVTSVQNVGPTIFLLADNVGYGSAVWVFYIYQLQNDHWQLVYVGNGGLRPSASGKWRCAYFEAPRKFVRLTTANGQVLSTVAIGIAARRDEP